MQRVLTTGLISLALAGTSAADRVEPERAAPQGAAPAALWRAATPAPERAAGAALERAAPPADAALPAVSYLKLRPRVLIRGEVVTLADVLNFAQADPRLLAEIGAEPAAPGIAAPAEMQLTHQQVVARLRELGVNPARVLLGGASSCQIILEEAPPATAPGAVGPERAAPRGSPAGVAASDAPVLTPANQAPPGARTLADVLRAHVARELAELGGTVEIEFEHAGREFLELTTPPFDFSVRSTRGARLGLREFSVALRCDGQVQRTARIAASVRLVKSVLVAARPLNAGSYVRRDSIELAPRVFTDAQELGIEHPEEVIGQEVKNFLPVGQMLRRSDLKPVDLVRRSQPVTVVGAGTGSGVLIRVTGDALDSGGYGDVVRVRLGERGRNRREVRGVVAGVGMVRLLDDGV